MGSDTGALAGEGAEDGGIKMRLHLDGSELSFIPDTDEERALLTDFMSKVEKNLVDADLDGVTLDELVLSPFCDGDSSHCRACGKPL